MPAEIFPFYSRAQLLHRRGRRNYDRYMRITKGFVDVNGPERQQWRVEDLAEARADADWAKGHGPVEGGAVVTNFPDIALQTPQVVGRQQMTAAALGRPKTDARCFGPDHIVTVGDDHG